MYLQDNLRAMGSASSQQEANLKSADCLIANTIDTAASYSEFDFEICPIGVDERLFSPLDKSLVRRKYGIPLDCQVGIFVGALDSVKGWPEIFQIIKEEETIEWIVVTKYDAVVTHPRIRHFSNQKQEVVVELLNCADFFVLGSRVETQCLAAIEAALCDVPVVIRPVGVFSSLTQDEADLVGYIGHDLRGGILEVLKHSKSCNPRKLILQRMPTLEETADRWWWICCREKMKALSGKDPANKNSIKEVKLITKILNEVDFFYRFKVLRPLIKRDTLYSISEISVYLKRRCPQNVYKLLRFIWRTATIKM
jgi:glycosyltransferase involved in cell wall biosynthesis